MIPTNAHPNPIFTVDNKSVSLGSFFEYDNISLFYNEL